MGFGRLRGLRCIIGMGIAVPVRLRLRIMAMSGITRLLDLNLRLLDLYVLYSNV